MNPGEERFVRARRALQQRCELGRLRTQLEQLERAQRRRPELAPARAERVPTGFAALDQRLGGGWLRGALNELLLPGDGCGALEAFLPRLLAPALPDAGGGARLVAWIDPQRWPYPPALAQAGLDLARCLVVRPRDGREQAWALDLALRSCACDVVIGWLHHLDDRSLRRLQLAAAAGDALALLLRPEGFARVASPAAVRLLVEPLPTRGGADGGAAGRRRLRVTPLRCRGGAVTGEESLRVEWSRDPLDEPAPAALRAGAAVATATGPDGGGVAARADVRAVGA